MNAEELASARLDAEDLREEKQRLENLIAEEQGRVRSLEGLAVTVEQLQGRPVRCRRSSGAGDSSQRVNKGCQLCICGRVCTHARRQSLVTKPSETDCKHGTDSRADAPAQRRSGASEGTRSSSVSATCRSSW